MSKMVFLVFDNGFLKTNGFKFEINIDCKTNRQFDFKIKFGNFCRFEKLIDVIGIDKEMSKKIK